MGNDFTKAAVSAGHFWEKPSISKIGKISRPQIEYKVGVMYRGSRSIITDEELKACKVIIEAFRRYKKRIQLKRLAELNNKGD